MRVIVEVGSTVTKVDIYDGRDITRLKDVTIQFKKHYSENGKIDKEDFDSLVSLVVSLKKEYEDVYVCGTSIFRTLSEEERDAFLKDFKAKTECEFDIISQDEEGKYTVLGAVRSVKNRACVFVGGGGSCEIVAYENGIEGIVNVPFGVIDVMNNFLDLAEDKASTSLDVVMEYIKKRLNKIDFKADVLILAGGGHEKFARLSGIKYEKNTLFEDKCEPIMMDIETRKNETKRYFEDISLDVIKSKVDDPDWWYATRAMCAFVLVVAEMVEAKYIVPTDIGMVHGIVNGTK